MTHPQYPAPPAPPVTARPSRAHYAFTAAVGVLGLVVGCGVGVALVEPETIVETKTRTVTEEVVPQVCIDALDYSADSMVLYANALRFLAFDQMDELSANTEAMDELSPDLKTTTLQCRVAAEN